MKPELSTIPPHLSKNPPVPDSDAESGSIRSRILDWLAHFFLYLGTVSVVCAIGFYLLWQIPIMQNPSQFFEKQWNLSSRPVASTTPSAKPQESPTDQIQPLANPTDTAMPEATAATSALTTDGAEAESDLNAPPLVIEQPDTSTDDSTEIATTVEETPPEEPTPATPQEEIQQLLADAQQQMASRRLTAPASSNALQTYQRILQLEPGNPAALEGIQNIAAYYRDVAEKSLRQGRPDESLAYTSRGLRATPQNSNLLNLRQEARLAQQQREQAQLEEIRRQQAEEAYAEQQYQERLRQQRAQESQAAQWWRQSPGSGSGYNNTGGFNQR